ncbi:ionotropic receptor 75a-like [Culex pipiens pallens]|uniref:ionotropic receptor 75a-like n=1 Tax=Culex pipiens pallens TaxID=42434 RepID=UPI0019537FF4|nr:ionotropic receptor 75a-like [Culex pipiens pallens]
MQFRSIFLVLSVLNGCTCSPILTAVADLIRCLNYPVQITVMQDGCWSDPEKTFFWRELATIPAAVRFSGLDVGDLPWDDPNQHRNLLVVDASCPGTKRLLQQAGQLLYYRVKWIVIDRGNLDCGRFLRFFDDLKVLISSEVYYLCAGEGVEGYSVRQVYRYSIESSLVEEVFGYWYRGVVVRNDHAAIAASVRRQNLNRFKLRASVVITHNATLNHLEDYKEKHVDTITKKNYFLTKYMIENLNATVQYSYVNSWGYRNPKTGRFSGMIGELQADQADLGATALFLTADRIREIDYLSMTTPTRAKFIFRSPKLSVTDNVFILPFNGTVWMCIISFIVLSATLLLIIMLVEFRYTTVRYGSFRPTLMDTMMNMFGTSCQQGSFMEPKSLPTRCLILLSLIVLMFLYASYSANIVALIQSPSRKIRTVEDLLNSRLETGAEDTVYNKYYFMHETEPIRKALFERKMRSRDGSLDRFIPLEKGVERLRQGLYAFHVELGVGYKVISETYQEDEKCGLQEIEYLNIIDPYYAVQKNSSFREIVRLSLFKLREFGIQGREHSMLYTKKPTCSGGSSFIPVTIVDVWPALVLLWWGFGIAAGLVVGEFGLKKRRDIRGRFFKRSRVNAVKPMGLS